MPMAGVLQNEGPASSRAVWPSWLLAIRPTPLSSIGKRRGDCCATSGPWTRDFGPSWTDAALAHLTTTTVAPSSRFMVSHLHSRGASMYERLDPLDLLIHSKREMLKQILTLYPGLFD